MKLGIVVPVLPSRERTTFPVARGSIGSVLAERIYVKGEGLSGDKLNRGVAEAIARGCTHYIFLSDDDAFVPGWYEAHIAGLESDPEADFVYGDILAVDEIGNPLTVWSPPPYSHEALLSEPTLPGVGIINVDVWRRAGGYENIPYGQDWLMFAKAAPLRVVRIPGVWYAHRQWASTETARGDRGPLNRELERLRNDYHNSVG